MKVVYVNPWQPLKLYNFLSYLDEMDIDYYMEDKASHLVILKDLDFNLLQLTSKYIIVEAPKSDKSATHFLIREDI